MFEERYARQDLWNFSLQFVTPTVRRSLPDPVSAVYLDISCADGPRVQAAARLFRQSIGVDVAEMIDLADARKSHSPNSEYRVRETGKLPVETGTIDYAYTLRGLTFLKDLSKFDAEIAEVARVLKLGGIAMLWFGRITRLPFVVKPSHWIKGYSYDPGDSIPLKVRQMRVRKALRKAGLKHVALSTPFHPDTSWRLFRGGELSYVTALKPG